ncbi:MAG TPA: acyl-CoA synthetase [Planctomycetes bacterium]|nr:acyl-CoA synthetase [Planctomycetota bacterium]
MTLDKFFNPSSVAVIGASRQKGKVGFDILDNLIAGGFAGDIYPVNPKAEEVLGLKCYPDIASLPKAPDLAVIVLPAPYVPDAISALGEKGTQAAIVISAGFKETGPEGLALEERTAGRARAAGVRMLGPNCLGIASTAAKLNASFGAMPLPGSIGLLSQSGALITGVLDTAEAQMIGFSAVFSIGNKADIDEEEVIRALADHDGTKVIAGYLENIIQGEKFIRTAEQVVPHKPLIIVKAGSTRAGAQAASSHTGSLAGTEAAYQCAFRRSGVIRANSIEHLFDMAMLFAEQPLPAGDRFAVITNAGGPGIMAADACESMGLTFARLAPETEAALKALLPPAANIHNPIDVLGDSPADRYAQSLAIVLKDPGVDIVLVLLTPQAMTDAVGTAQAIAEQARGCGKPVMACFVGYSKVQDGIAVLRQHRIPVYREPARALAAVKAACDYVEFCVRPPRVVRRFAINRGRVEKIIRRHRRMGLRLIGEQDAKDILQAYGVYTAAGDTAHTTQDAVRIANRIGYPVVMKIASPDISHKSDVGGVKIGLRNAQEVEDAFELMMLRVGQRAPEARLDGVVVQEMVVGGKEVIIGMTRDAQFGPLLMFGLGGIYVEFIKDIAFELAPLTDEEATNLITSTKTYALLRGVRGEEATDVEQIAECLLRISQLVIDFPEIAELDINPLKVRQLGQAAVAIDARIGLARAEE